MKAVVALFLFITYLSGCAKVGSTHRENVSIQASNKSAANSPVKSSAPERPARMVLAVPDEPDRGRLSVETYEAKRTSVRGAVRFQRQYGGSPGPEYKPVLQDELAVVATVHRYPPERLRKNRLDSGWSVMDDTSAAESLTKNNHPSPPLDTDTDPTLQLADTDLETSSSPLKPDNSQIIQQPMSVDRDRSATKDDFLARIAPRLSRSTADLPVTYGTDGHIRIDLKGHFSHVSLAKRMPDGTIRHTCVDNIKSAKAWLSSGERPKQR